jgi:hypothetical protein
MSISSSPDLLYVEALQGVLGSPQVPSIAFASTQPIFVIHWAFSVG